MGNRIVDHSRCSWSIICQHCCNYIFILDLTSGFKELGKDNYKTKRETLKFWMIWCNLFRGLTVQHLGYELNSLIVWFISCTCRYYTMILSYTWSSHHVIFVLWSGIYLGMRPANDRRCYIVTSLIGWTYTWTNPCMVLCYKEVPQ